MMALPATGTYRIVFGANNGGLRRIPYRLVDTASATNLSFVATTVGTLDPPHRATFYRFDANAGQTFNFDSIVGVFFANAVLFGPTNNHSIRSE